MTTETDSTRRPEAGTDPVHHRRWPLTSALLAALGLVLWIGFFLAPALQPGRALLGVDLLMRFPPWDAQVAPEWEARNHLLFDQAVQFYPWRLLTRSLAAAHLPPLWNPYAGTGSPLLANYQSATLAPVELLVSGLDPTRAPAVAAAIRLAIAGAGMLLLLRRFGLPAIAACFGTLAFLGSGAITILLYHPNSNASVWLTKTSVVAQVFEPSAGPEQPRLHVMTCIFDVAPGVASSASFEPPPHALATARRATVARARARLNRRVFMGRAGARRGRRPREFGPVL